MKYFNFHYEIMYLLSKSEKGERGKCLSIAINVN